jgi:xanthine dehydrogenase accessory factor
VEGAAAELIAEARRDGCSRVVRFGISDEQAWGVGLACGSTIDVLIEPTLRPEVEQAAREESGAAVIIPLPADAPAADGKSGRIGMAPPAEVTLLRAGEVTAVNGLGQAAMQLISQRRSETVVEGDDQFFIETFAPPPRIVVFGAVQAAIPLVGMAKELGYRTVVADAREAFASRERFPDADEVLVGWPDEIAHELNLGPDDAVVVMTHDPKLDEPAIVEAMRAGARYVGAMGSKRTQAGRRERLLREGLTEQQLSQLRGPIGLDLGGREPGEMALAILAEIVAERNAGTTIPLSQKWREQQA